MKKTQIQLSDHFTYQKLLRFVLPSIVMMVFTSIYGVVDGLFVSNFAGQDAVRGHQPRDAVRHGAGRHRLHDRHGRHGPRVQSPRRGRAGEGKAVFYHNDPVHAARRRGADGVRRDDDGKGRALPRRDRRDAARLRALRADRHCRSRRRSCCRTCSRAS